MNNMSYCHEDCSVCDESRELCDKYYVECKTVLCDDCINEDQCNIYHTIVGYLHDLIDDSKHDDCDCFYFKRVLIDLKKI